MNGAKNRIAVFDSGVGGLSVLRELQNLMPKFEYSFCFDNAFYPYGTKNDEELIQRLTTLLPVFVENCEAKILVIACNTASTIALEQIRQKVHIPVVGVVPAIKPAAKISKTKVIGLLATEGTIRRKYTDDLIQEFASDCEIIKIGSRKLVECAEAKIRGETLSLPEIASELSPFFEKENLDSIVLACTHFDHLREEFEQIAGERKIHWISSASAVALRTKTLAEDLDMQTLARPKHQLISTKVSSLNPIVLEALLKQYGFHSFETLIL
jgi:glutamate racemase